jgi:hypothetical protein
VACDIRKLYYQSYRADWSGSILNALSDAQLNKCPGAHLGFTAAQCEGIRKQLHDEVSMVAQVTHYFGPLGLQQPFGANAGVAALANLKVIGDDITAAVEPPAADKTTSGALDVLSEVLHIGGALAGGVEEKTAEVVAETLSGAFGLTAYFTEADGEPNLIGPRITTAASKLGVELADRYTQAGKNLDDLGRLIVSDYGKLKAVASKADAVPRPGETDWRLGDVAAAQKGLERAAKRTIYERLVPLAYPVMYDVGPIGARDWQCQGGFLKANKHLFADQADGAQFIGRFQGWTTVVAVAQEHATGTVYDARIPGIPASITDVLFNPVTTQGGLGLNKLEFYSPRNGFRYLPENPEDPHIHKYGVGENLNTLTEFPYWSYGGAIYCSEIPDPPGNSG